MASYVGRGAIADIRLSPARGQVSFGGGFRAFGRPLATLQERRYQVVGSADLEFVGHHPLMFGRELHVPDPPIKLVFQDRIAMAVAALDVFPHNIDPDNRPRLFLCQLVQFLEAAVIVIQAPNVEILAAPDGFHRGLNRQLLIAKKSRPERPGALVEAAWLAAAGLWDAFGTHLD